MLEKCNGFCPVSLVKGRALAFSLIATYRTGNCELTLMAKKPVLFRTSREDKNAITLVMHYNGKN